MGKHDHFADSDADFLAQLDQQVEQTHHGVVAEPAGTDADFLARLDRQVEQAHQDIATTYTYARRDAFDAHTAKPG